MKRRFIPLLFVLLLAGALGLTLFTRVKKANAEVAAGNRAFAAQDYETALKHYTAAQSQVPGQAEPLYNAANVYYQQKALDQAQQSLDGALAKPDKSIEGFIRFNLGNVAYLAGQFDVAVSQYEAALRIDPADQAAKYNLELALLQQDQQNQQQDQQNQQQDEQDQQEQEQNQQGQQNQQDQKDPSQDQQNQKDRQQDQQSQQDQQQDQQGQPGQQPDQPGQPDQQAAQPGQSGQPQGQQPDQPNGQAYGGQPQQELTSEQARQLLAAIAGDSKTLLQQLQEYYIIPGGDPEKDW